ncbi:MAG: hypothetical protein K6B65_04360 [Bacilli bacterium]|nr:hypothetical protein [Bacilli bacterium]
MDDFKKKLDEIIEEQKAAEELNEAKKKERFYGFLGFTFFDIIHILLGLYFFITLLVKSPSAHLEVAESAMEVVLSVTLIVFIHGLADTSIRGKSFIKSYSFAWLMASASLLTPCLFKVVEWDVKDMEGLIANIFLLAINGVLYFSFFFALLLKKQRFVWRILVLVGIICGFLSSAASITCFVIDPLTWNEEPIQDIILTIIKHLAPAILSTMAAIGYAKVYKEVRKMQEGK